MTDDEDYAAAILDNDDNTRKPPRRTVIEWTPEIEMLSNLYDRIGELITITLAAAGSKKPPRAAPAPRPRTGIDRLRDKRRAEQHRSLTARLLPGRTPPELPGGSS